MTTPPNAKVPTKYGSMTLFQSSFCSMFVVFPTASVAINTATNNVHLKKVKIEMDAGTIRRPRIINKTYTNQNGKINVSYGRLNKSPYASGPAKLYEIIAAQK